MTRKNKKIIDLGEIYVDINNDQEAMVDFIESLLESKDTEAVKQVES